YPRANDIIQAFERQGAHVTLFPMFQHDESWDGVRRCIPPGVEVVLEGEAALLGAFLRERAGCFDAIFVSRPHNMQVLREALDREPTLRGDALLIYDAEALFAPRDALKAEILGSPLGAAEVQARLESEVSLVRGSDLVLSVSPLERDLFRKKGVADVRLLGHAVEIDPTEAPFGKRPDFLFLGAVHDDDSPNADSILWFARDVLPYIRRELGQSVRLKVVGLVQAPAVLELDGVDLELLGRLDDVRPAFETARVVVIPTRYAAGIPHKAHHAASLGVPIVATELIARQLGWQDGRDLMASSDALGFAQACIELYRNETLWTELRTQSIERVREDCSEGAFDRSIRDVLTLVTEPAAKRPAGENS
ncbi:MAG: glycosyl transferase, partial [Sphingomonas taxi]